MRLLSLLLLLAVPALAQVQTRKLHFPSDGSFVSTTIVTNGFSIPSTAYLASNLADPYAAQCATAAGNITNRPYFNMNDNLGFPGNTLNPQYVYFNTALGSWTYPVSVTLTKLTFRLCYLLNGYINKATSVTPVIRNKTTGVTYNAGAAVLVAGGAFSYTATDTVPYSSAELSWTFSSTGTPDIASVDWDNFEFGLAMQGRSIPSIKIFGIETRASWAAFTTAPTTLPAVPAISYTSGSPFSNGRIYLDVTMPDPSAGVGVRPLIRCRNNIYVALPDFVWGSYQTPFRHVLRNYALNVINTTYCTGANTLAAGDSTNIRLDLLNTNGNVYGSSTTTNNIIL